MESSQELDLHKKVLLPKYEEILRRIAGACDQLSEEELAWRPTPESNSIANLIVHICGNIHERIGAGMLGRASVRRREEEFRPDVAYSREQLMAMLRDAFAVLCRTLEEATPELLLKTQTIRGKERSNLALFHQCAGHFSEHLGQVLYIAKMRLGGRYESTSI
ncbi:DUF1572 family protein [Paenibacillus hamazuiensis]|uniref:DUF1572 family protein n=1 Tax=Paenibacillus hamazuiensis TaxID=2936508 RepID=UPI0020103B72|nr:DUF1572 family protein [Paenibacillus hamazuiensis]